MLKDRLPGRKKCGLLDFEIDPRAEDEKCRMKMKNEAGDTAGFRAMRLSSLQVYKMDPARGCLDERGVNKDILALQFPDCKEDARALRLTTVEFRCERVLQVDDKALFVRPGAANKGCQPGGDAVVTSTSGGQRQRQPVVQVKRFFAESATPLSYALQKYRTSINRNTNFSRRKNGVCNADFAQKQDLSCMIAISRSAILLHRICRGVLRTSQVSKSCTVAYPF